MLDNDIVSIENSMKNYIEYLLSLPPDDAKKVAIDNLCKVGIVTNNGEFCNWVNC